MTPEERAAMNRRMVKEKLFTENYHEWAGEEGEFAAVASGIPRGRITGADPSPESWSRDLQLLMSQYSGGRGGSWSSRDFNFGQGRYRTEAVRWGGD